MRSKDPPSLAGYRRRVPFPEEYRDRDPWRDPRGGYRQGAYPQGQYPPAQFARPAQPPGDAGLAGPAGRQGGADGNERLTVMTGAVLLILLAAEGFTILGIGRLLTWHFFIGMLLLGPVALKAGSVSYRFFRYYTGHADYRRKGPPALLLRLLGPFIMLLTACVFGTGVILALVGPSARQPWLLLHKATFILWLGAMTIHVLAYVWRLPRLLYAEARGVALPEAGASRYGSRAASMLGGRAVRLSLLVASLLAGLVIALLTVHLASAWQSPYQFFNH